LFIVLVLVKLGQSQYLEVYTIKYVSIVSILPVLFVY